MSLIFNSKCLRYFMFMNTSNIKKFIPFIFIIPSFSVLSDIALIENLSFGKIAITDNSVQSQIIVDRFGATSTTNNAWIVVPGHAAEILLSNYPPGLRFYLSANIPSPTTSSIAPTQFTLMSVDMAPSIDIQTSGTATIKIGGVMQSSGNSINYVDTTYSSIIDVTINY